VVSPVPLGAFCLHQGGGDYSKWGRVTYTLARRLELLEEVRGYSDGFPALGVCWVCDSEWDP
jgi:hypothetical protein